MPGFGAGGDVVSTGLIGSNTRASPAQKCGKGPDEWATFEVRKSRTHGFIGRIRAQGPPLPGPNGRGRKNPPGTPYNAGKEASIRRSAADISYVLCLRVPLNAAANALTPSTNNTLATRSLDQSAKNALPASLKPHTLAPPSPAAEPQTAIGPLPFWLLFKQPQALMRTKKAGLKDLPL